MYFQECAEHSSCCLQRAALCSTPLADGELDTNTTEYIREPALSVYLPRLLEYDKTRPAQWLARNTCEGKT